MSDNALTTIEKLQGIIVAFFACLPPTLLAWASLRASQKNAAKADTLLVKTEAIHQITNSNLSQVTAALAVANERIQGLEKLMGEMVASKKEAKDVESKRRQP